MTQKEIIQEIEKLGYKVSFKYGTDIIEEYKSTIDGEIFERKPCWSTKHRDFGFLENCLPDLKGYKQNDNKTNTM